MLSCKKGVGCSLRLWVFCRRVPLCPRKASDAPKVNLQLAVSMPFQQPHYTQVWGPINAASRLQQCDSSLIFSVMRSKGPSLWNVAKMMALTTKDTTLLSSSCAAGGDVSVHRRQLLPLSVVKVAALLYADVSLVKNRPWWGLRDHNGQKSTPHTRLLYFN